MMRRPVNEVRSAALEAYLARSESGTAFLATLLVDRNTVTTAYLTPRC
jgi:hypothetical protein